MSVSGPSPLGTLLATRLDAVLGTTLAQHPVLLQGVRGHAVTQATSALHPQDSVIRRGAGEVAEAGGRSRSRAGEADAALRSGRDAGRGGPAQTGPAPSARATLSEPARLILALLVSRPPIPSGTRPALPLWPGAQDASATRFTARGGAGTQPGSQPGTPGVGSSRAPAGTPLPGRPTAPAPGQAANTGARAQPSSTGTPMTDRTGQPGAGAEARLAAAARTAATGQPTSGAQGGDAAGRAAASSLTASATIGASNPMSQALAATLARAVASSGVFYESHLARLAFGQMGLDSILREPQARLPNPPTPPAAAPHAQPAQQGGAHSLSQWLGSPMGAGADAPVAAAPRNEPALPVPGIHPEAAPLVRQQLETLANGQFAWQGEAWPGTPMDWEVGEEPRQPDDDGTPAWATRLRLHLPHLGEIEVRMRLSGNQVLLRLGAADSSATLQAASSDLRERMLEAGLIVSDLAFASLDKTAGAS
ncbi:hypothetical protein FOZ76_09645 [Verticiella sediminum]|uniref:Flagellar hook-length control protein-like C-terminal domain-containing protein n=1 Tax=Verticiella sediminum TaxID=1247510 RepID=A0A556ART6_9BURK|nr:flagellar hook-length control protein FliK [Verticiella sediminum]TSH95654.1 hypothetical protein FOZ76_09645 [Verticiella sediminum]